MDYYAEFLCFKQEDLVPSLDNFKIKLENYRFCHNQTEN